MNPDYVLVFNGFVYSPEGDRYVCRARRGRLLPGAPNPTEVIETWVVVDEGFYPPTGPDFERASVYGNWQWLHKDKVARYADRLDQIQVEHVRSVK